MLDQENNFYVISLGFHTTCFLDSVEILLGEVISKLFLEVKRLSDEVHVE